MNAQSDASVWMRDNEFLGFCSLMLYQYCQVSALTVSADNGSCDDGRLSCAAKRAVGPSESMWLSHYTLVRWDEKLRRLCLWSKILFGCAYVTFVNQLKSFLLVFLLCRHKCKSLG
ncbi:hypothetical protein L1049_008961 [Liquidambar formosana]|uniref:Uncharacterized protein n=1 Tax=Liquidambar formosana TaxID=63359 RepID=A0AAP0X8M2_LIQFO